MCEKVTIYWLIEIWIVSIGYQINANHALLLAGIRSVYRSKNSISSDFSISLLNCFFSHSFSFNPKNSQNMDSRWSTKNFLFRMFWLFINRMISKHFHNWWKPCNIHNHFHFRWHETNMLSGYNDLVSLFLLLLNQIKM